MLLLRHHIVRKLLIIHSKRLVSNLDDPCPHLTLPIQVLERIKIFHLILEQVVVGDLLFWLPPIKLILEYPYLVIEGNQFVVECPTLVWLFVIDARICEALFALGWYGLLGLQLASSSLSIEVPSHEIFVGLEVLVEVDNLLNGDFVGTSIDGSVHELPCLLSQ